MKRVLFVLIACCTVVISLQFIRLKRNRDLIKYAIAQISLSESMRYIRGYDVEEIAMSKPVKEKLIHALNDIHSFPSNFTRRAGFGSLVFLDANRQEMLVILLYPNNTVQIDGVLFELSSSIIDMSPTFHVRPSV